jgi:hypothetical protein
MVAILKARPSCSFFLISSLEEPTCDGTRMRSRAKLPTTRRVQLRITTSSSRVLSHHENFLATSFWRPAIDFNLDEVGNFTATGLLVHLWQSESMLSLVGL